MYKLGRHGHGPGVVSGTWYKYAERRVSRHTSVMIQAELFPVWPPLRFLMPEPPELPFVCACPRIRAAPGSS